MEAKYGSLKGFIPNQIIKGILQEANEKFKLELTLEDCEKAIASEFEFVVRKISGATKNVPETFPKAIWLEYLGTFELSEKRLKCVMNKEYRNELKAINLSKKEL